MEYSSVWRVGAVMKCLKCGVAMTTKALGRERVDICPDCGGTWFDHGELESVRRSKTRAKRETPTVLVPGPDLLEMSCPRCDCKEMKIFEAHGFEVERCTDCRGIFLEGDEMEKLLAEWGGTRRVRFRTQKVEDQAKQRQYAMALLAGMIISGG